MIAYRILRAFGRLALRWFYRDVEVVGMEHLPEDGPAMLASNHPNALVDALVIGCTVRRPITLTAKATLLDNPITRVLFRVAGVVPLRRASDAIRRGSDGILDPGRNINAFVAVLDVLEEGGVVLLFPEGKSHSDPALAPLKTGLARIAVMARNERQLRIPIIPVGLTFERKWEPRSRVLMHLGTPIVAEGAVPNVPDAVTALTQRVDAGLREVTLNFGSTDEARRVMSLSSVLAEVLDDFRPLGTPDPPLAESVRVAQRIATIVPHFAASALAVGSRVDRFLERFAAFEASTNSAGIAASDIQMSTDFGSGLWFAVRELFIAAVAGPFAVWGRVNHWLPIRIARSIASRVSRTLDEPAMNTIVAGLVSVLVFYIAQIGFVAWWLGRIAALAYAISLPLSATWDFRYTDRIRRGLARVRTYLRFRRDPHFHNQLLTDLAWLRTEALALDSLVSTATTPNAAIV